MLQNKVNQPNLHYIDDFIGSTVLHTKSSSEIRVIQCPNNNNSIKTLKQQIYQKLNLFILERYQGMEGKK